MPDDTTPCVHVAHNGYLDIAPLQRIEHEFAMMYTETQTEAESRAVEEAIAAVRKLLAVVRERDTLA